MVERAPSCFFRRAASRFSMNKSFLLFTPSCYGVFSMGCTKYRCRTPAFLIMRKTVWSRKVFAQKHFGGFF